MKSKKDKDVNYREMHIAAALLQSILSDLASSLRMGRKKGQVKDVQNLPPLQIESLGEALNLYQNRIRQYF
ncbi:hypothetical protein BT69DRAFT_274826 [Atractiella rhizophila]|nr:hypothetical protein BT69DRAFT_274826 [Atractiella rhizophila]